MAKRRPNRKSGGIATAGLVIALGLTWFFAAPLPLLGQNSYLITSGTSMLPGIERGDLVVTRRASEYRVGDVVAYRDPHIGPVLHRIIAREGDRFVLQGDNNNFIDPYQPERSDLMGKMLLHVPGVGGWLSKAHEPRNAAFLVPAGGMVLAAPVGARQAQQRRRRGRGGGGAMPPPREPRRPRKLTLDPLGQTLGMLAGCIALAALALAGLAYSMPLERDRSVPVDYQQRGEFSYSAEMDGTVYASGLATTGDPVYRQLADEIAIRFDYQLASEAVVSASGTYRLDAVIRQDDGWTRSVPIIDETSFDGAMFSLDGTLDIERLQTEVDAARSQTGLDSQPLRSYRVDVVPTISLDALVSGLPVHEVYAPAMQLTGEPLVVTLDAPGDSVTDAAFKTTTAGTVNAIQSVPRTLPLPGLDLTVATARSMAQVGFGLAGAVALLLVVIIGYASHGDEPARIRSRYGPLLIALRGYDLGADGRLIEVGSIEDLVKVAEREGRMVLHQESGSIHQYFVQDVDVTYRYQTLPLPSVRRQGVERAL